MKEGDSSSECCQSGSGCSCLKKVSGCMETHLEGFFESLGRTVGRHPGWTIGLTFTFALLCMAGMIRFQQESRSEKLWVPSNADSLTDKEWIERNFPETSRALVYILEAKPQGNVLDPDALREAYKLHMEILNVTSPGSTFFKKHKQTYSDFCFSRVPGKCQFGSILALWEFNKTVIERLTISDILDKINSPNLTDPWNQLPIDNITRLIGGIERNEQRNIVRAKALNIFYLIVANETFDDSTGGLVDDRASDFELAAEKVVLKDYTSFTGYVFAQAGFVEEASKAIQNDLSLLAAGYFIIIFYVCINLGKFNRLYHKAWLSLGGVVSTGLGIGASFGLCSLFGLFYGPVHSVLPFLLIGIGVDDMFVIVSAWENLPEKTHREESVPERIAKTLKKAGVSVTVTSFTDLVAFLVGATTILPALRSFCVFAGIGIFLDFFFQITLFVALLAIDGYRSDSRRDACLCCVRLPKDYTESICCWNWWPFKGGWLKKFIGDTYACFLMKVPVKVIVLVATFGLFGASVFGATELKREFNFRWFLPSGSFLLDFFDAQDKYFPSNGYSTAIYTGEIDYFAKKDMFAKLEESVAKDPYIDEQSIRSWYTAYRQWKGSTSIPNNGAEFYVDVKFFLYNGTGAQYRKDVLFNKSGAIVASRIPADHIKLVTTSEEVDAMVSIRDTVSSVALIPKAFAYSEFYLNWESNLVIRQELLRNLGLALLCVFIVTLVLLADLWGSLLVLGCVSMILVDVAGLMHFWGLTVDTVTTVCLILAIGIAVDYAAHVTHTFLVPHENAKTRNERVICTLSLIGTAVWNGGFSTFLAFVLLAGSGSYVFTTFFKVFFLVVVCGLFHSLCFLPVVLSLIGPPSYQYIDHDDKAPEKAIQLNEAVDKPPVFVEDSIHESQKENILASEEPRKSGKESLSPSPPNVPSNEDSLSSSGDKDHPLHHNESLQYSLQYHHQE